MKIRIKNLFIHFLVLVLALVFFNGNTNKVSAESEQKRIKFQIRVIGENTEKREVFTQANIEGLPGTDFRVNLNTKNFKMKAKFLSDLISNNELKLRVKLETRRFYGMSPIDLPLYEEDKQKHNLKFGFDEKVVLLPFGRNGGNETLKIEITSKMFAVPKNNEDSQKLEINFDKKMSNGEISIGASKIPHKFDVKAILLADGVEVANGKSINLIEEENQITLIPSRNAPAEIRNKSIKTNFTVDRFTRGRPKDFASIIFDTFSTKATSESEKLKLAGGRGVSQIGGELKYKIEGLSQDMNYEIKFRVNLSKDEKQ